jgi:hypothetical protein
VVERHRAGAERLANRLASDALAVQGGDDVGEVVPGERVDPAAADQRQQLVELDAVLQPSRVGDVDAGGLPAFRRFGKGGGRRLLGVQLGQVGNALIDKLARDVVAANLRELHPLERAAVADLRLASAQPVANAEALAAVLGDVGSDPGASHWSTSTRATVRVRPRASAARRSAA